MYTTVDRHSMFSNPSLDIFLTWARAPPELVEFVRVKVAALIYARFLRVIGNEIHLAKAKQRTSKLTKTEHYRCASVRSLILYLVLAQTLTTSVGDLCQKKRKQAHFLTRTFPGILRNDTKC